MPFVLTSVNGPEHEESASRGVACIHSISLIEAFTVACLGGPTPAVVVTEGDTKD